jgi:hypothetical protein
MKRALSRTLLVASMLLVAGVAAAAATRPATSPARKAHARTNTHRSTPLVTKAVPGAAGMRIFRDPETGEIGPPTAENTASLVAEKPVDVTTLPVVALPGGGYELLIDGKIEDAVVVKKAANGKLVWMCTQDPHTANQKPAPAAPKREDR